MSEETEAKRAADNVELELRERLVILEHELSSALRLAGLAAFASALALLIVIIMRRRMP